MDREEMCKLRLAKWLHKNYENLSEKHSWETQERCRTSFEDLPEENKKVMMDMAKRIIKTLQIQHHLHLVNNLFNVRKCPSCGSEKTVRINRYQVECESCRWKGDDGN